MPDGVWLGEGEELLAVDAGGGEGGGDVDPMVQKWWPRTSRAEGLLDDGHQPGRKKYYLTFSRNLGPPEKVEDELGLNISGEGGHQPQPGQVQVKVQVHFL